MVMGVTAAKVVMAAKVVTAATVEMGVKAVKLVLVHRTVRSSRAQRPVSKGQWSEDHHPRLSLCRKSR